MSNTEYEIKFQQFVIYKNLYREGGSKEILSPLFEVADHSQQLLIKDIVVAFNGREDLGEVITWVHISIHAVLHQHDI